MNRRALYVVATVSLLAIILALGLLAPRDWLVLGPRDWPMFRFDAARTGTQPHDSVLTNPAKVRTLQVLQTLSVPPGMPVPQQFRASPIVYKGKVFIGNTNGYFYAFDAETLAYLWHYPHDRALTTPSFPPFNEGVSSSFGIAASATIARVAGQDAVIFGAYDPNTEPYGGSPPWTCEDRNESLIRTKNCAQGYLFALDLNGRLIWRSDVIARQNGLTNKSYQLSSVAFEFHEKTGYSSPIVANNRVYVGIANHGDNPIQKGRVVAVHLDTGKRDDAFTFCAAGTCEDNQRGGGVWSSLAAWDKDLFVTTGNTRDRFEGTRRVGNTFVPISVPIPEPSPNHGLSLLRLDGLTGNIKWKFQPVPFELDDDPDWAAGAIAAETSCGPVIVSTQKDGWSYALSPERGGQPDGLRWNFPPYAVPFQLVDGTHHGDTQIKRPGATWGDVYVTTTGGWTVFSKPRIRSSYKRLQAFNVCAASQDRVRWILDVPGVSRVCEDGVPRTDEEVLELRSCLGPPTITGGIVFIGTNTGRLIAIADPAVSSAGLTYRCSDPDLPVKYCTKWGYTLVPQPEVLANIQLDNRKIMTEPVLVNGKVYVATDAGRVYLLGPRLAEVPQPIPPPIPHIPPVPPGRLSPKTEVNTSLPPFLVFEGSTSFHERDGRRRDIKLTVRTWGMGGSTRVTRFPQQGFLIVELNAGALTTIIGGKPLRRFEGDIWVVPAGSSMTVETDDDAVIIQVTDIQGSTAKRR